jgi:nucleoside-diphosphate-sugar epimerase
VIEDVTRDKKPIHYEIGGDTAFDFTYVKDFAAGAIQAYDCKSPNHCVYNLSFGQNRTMFQVFDVLRKLFPDLSIKIGPGLWAGVLTKGKQTDMTYRSSQRPPQDITRARQDFNFEPEWDLDRAIPDWIRWIQEGKY